MLEHLQMTIFHGNNVNTGMFRCWQFTCCEKKRDCGRATAKFTVFAETDLNCYMSTHTNDETV